MVDSAKPIRNLCLAAKYKVGLNLNLSYVCIRVIDLDYFIVRILKSRVRAGEILLTRRNGNFLATGFLI